MQNRKQKSFATGTEGIVIILFNFHCKKKIARKKYFLSALILLTHKLLNVSKVLAQL